MCPELDASTFGTDFGTNNSVVGLVLNSTRLSQEASFKADSVYE